MVGEHSVFINTVSSLLKGTQYAVFDTTIFYVFFSFQQETKRTPIDKELTKWLTECHELHDKQIHFTDFIGQIKRLDLPKNRQTPWATYKQVQ